MSHFHWSYIETIRPPVQEIANYEILKHLPVMVL